MSVYVYTQPKAGTYFISDLIERLGFVNTGYHIMRMSYLDTKAHALEINTQTPDVARVDEFFVPVIRRLREKDLAFGHFPVPLNPEASLVHTKYVCAYRDPKKAVISEFIDFRFRRKDMEWISTETIPNDREAFVTYLKSRGLHGYYNEFRQMLLYRSLIVHPLATQLEKDRAHFVNFAELLANPVEVEHIARFLGVELTSQQAVQIHLDALMAETKTKASSVNIDRAALWSAEAEELYNTSAFPKAVDYARTLGLTL